MSNEYPYLFMLDSVRIAAAAYLGGFSLDLDPSVKFTDVAGRKWNGMRPVTTITAIAIAESSGDIFSYNNQNMNGSRDLGLCQINTVHAQMFNEVTSPWRPVDAMVLSYQVYLNAGSRFTPWNGYSQITKWYYASKNLTIIRYASDGVTQFRRRLNDGESPEQILKVDLRDFSSYK